MPADFGRRVVRVIALTLAAGLGAFCGVIQAAAKEGQMLTTMQWILATATAGSVMAGALAAGLSEPPRSNPIAMDTTRTAGRSEPSRQ